MALLEFFHVNSLYACPVHIVVKPEFIGQQKLREIVHMMEKEEDGR